MTHAVGPIQKKKHEVLEGVLKALTDKFYKPELLDDGWRRAVEQNRASIESAATRDTFEQRMSDLLKTLKTSHIGFFHDSAQRASSRAALSATYVADETTYGSRWIFQDVHEGGAAYLAGLRPGNILLSVNEKEIRPPEHPAFPMGSLSELVIVANDDEERVLSVKLGKPQGKKLHFIEPTLVQSRKLDQSTGYLKVAMFPGMLGVDVANAMSKAVAELGSVSGLIVDLRGNTGGGAGALRLMSLLTPDRIPVGFAPGKKWADRDLSTSQHDFPRLNRIPASKSSLWLLAIRFLPSLLRKSPVVLETEGLGSKPYHGRIVLLVNRHTASAAEMVAIFAKENKLAILVGESTSGRLLSATSVKVGSGFRLALPTGAYRTWNGAVLEGTPIKPDFLAGFEWQECRRGVDVQLNEAFQALRGNTA